MKKILVFLSEGFEEIEAITVIDILRRAEIECITCSIEDKIVKGAHNIEVVADILLDEIIPYEYDGLILPGGMQGATNLRNNIKVVEMINEYFMSNKLIAAICAAPIVFEKANVTNGERMTSYPSFREQLANCIYLEDDVVIEENMITSRGPATAHKFAFEIVKYIKGENSTDELEANMLYK